MNYSIKAICCSIIFASFGAPAQADKAEQTQQKNSTAADAISRGAAAWAKNCGRCHNHRGPQEFRPDQWGPIIAHMRVQAGISEKTARDILAYMTEGASTEENGPHKRSDHMSPAVVKTSFRDRDHHMMEGEMGRGHMMGPGMMGATSEGYVQSQSQSKSKSDGGSSGGGSSYEKGKKIFDRNNCTPCHGRNGKGTIPGAPDFTKPDSPLQTLSDHELVERVKKGYKVMPAHPNLSDQQIEDVIAFMKKEFAQEHK